MGFGVKLSSFTSEWKTGLLSVESFLHYPDEFCNEGHKDI